MKRVYKIAIATIAIGIVLILVGLANHNPITLFNSHGQANFNSGKSTTRTYTAKQLAPFNAIDSNLEVSDLSIRSGKHYQVKVSGNNKFPVTVKVVNQKLLLTQEKRGIGWHNINNMTITVTVPHPNTLTSVVTDSDAGDLELNGLKLQNLKLSLDSGDVDITNSDLQNCHSELDAGDVNIEHSRLTGNNYFELDSGDFTMNHANKHATYELSADSGDISCFDYDAEEDFTHKGSNQNRFKIEADSGDIDIS